MINSKGILIINVKKSKVLSACETYKSSKIITKISVIILIVMNLSPSVGLIEQVIRVRLPILSSLIKCSLPPFANHHHRMTIYNNPLL